MASGEQVNEAKARKKFIKAFGVGPDYDKDKLISVKFKQYAKYLDTTIFEGNENLEVNPIFGRDVPQYMSQDEFMVYLQEKSNEIKTNIAPSIAQVRQTKSAGDAVAILVVPPISIFLSLTSILLNVALLGYAWLVFFTPKQGKYAYLVPAVYFVVITILFSSYIYSKQSVLATSDYWTKAEQLQSTQHPILSYLWNYTLKVEPILCQTEIEPAFVQRYTNEFYNNPNFNLKIFKKNQDTESSRRRLDYINSNNKANLEMQKLSDQITKRNKQMMLDVAKQENAKRNK